MWFHVAHTVRISKNLKEIRSVVMRTVQIQADSYCRYFNYQGKTHLLCTCFACHLHLENMGILISEAVRRRLADASKQEPFMSATAKWNFAWYSSLFMIMSSLERIKCDHTNHNTITSPFIIGLYLRCNMRLCFSQAIWDVFSILCSIVPAYVI